MSLTESKSYLFQIPEIEAIIISFLNKSIDHQKLVLINKYFYQITTCDKTYLELRKFSRKMKSLRVYSSGKHNKLTITFMKSCKYGYPLVAKHLYQMYSDRINIHADNEYAFRWSCHNGCVDIVQFLLSLNDKIDIHAENECAFRWSCEKGHIIITNLLLSLDKFDIHVENEYAFTWSCANGHLDTVKLLIGLDNKINIHINNDYAFFKSCLNGHIDTVKFLFSLDEDNFLSIVKYILSINYLIKSHEMLMWLKSLINIEDIHEN